MNILKLGLIAIFIGLNIANAATDGGGAGGFCVEDQCVTLAEAGFRIKEKSLDTPVVSSAVFNEMKSIIQSLPLTVEMKSDLVLYSTGTSEIYKKVDSYNEENFDSYKSEYRKILSENPQYKPNPAEELKLFAVSNRDNTYILPKFYSLSTRSQALVLIHEGIIRKTQKVPLALRIDGAIQDNLDGNFNSYDIVYVLLSAGFRVEHLISQYELWNSRNHDSGPSVLPSQTITLWSYMREKTTTDSTRLVDISSLFKKTSPYNHGLKNNKRVHSLDASTMAEIYEKDKRLWRIFTETETAQLLSISFERNEALLKSINVLCKSAPDGIYGLLFPKDLIKNYNLTSVSAHIAYYLKCSKQQSVEFGSLQASGLYAIKLK
ncbi:MAG: hypothetical protein V4596_07495 [Bdellovibrionota bacterium]